MEFRRFALLSLLVAVLFSGCGYKIVDPDPTKYPPTPSPSPKIPATGKLLADFGIKHGPPGFSLPKQVVPKRVIDQDNVVTVIMSVTDGQATMEYLQKQLFGAGYEIQGISHDSILFYTTNWQGALTIGLDEAGLTLRKQKS